MREGGIPCRGIAHTISFQDRIVDVIASLLQEGTCLRQLLAEVVGGGLDGDALRLAQTVGLLVLVAHLALRRVDGVFLAQPLHGLEEAHLLVLLEEGEHVATLTADEALVALLHRGDEERGRTVIVERADALVVHTGLPECQELADDVDDVGRVVDLVDHFL